MARNYVGLILNEPSRELRDMGSLLCPTRAGKRLAISVANNIDSQAYPLLVTSCLALLLFSSVVAIMTFTSTMYLLTMRTKELDLCRCLVSHTSSRANSSPVP